MVWTALKGCILRDQNSRNFPLGQMRKKNLVLVGAQTSLFEYIDIHPYILPEQGYVGLLELPTH